MNTALIGAIANGIGNIAMMIDPEKNRKFAQVMQVAGQVASAIPSSGSGGGQASGGGAAAKTPKPAGPTPQTPFKPDMQGKTAAQQQQLTKAVNQQNAWLKDQQAPKPKAELLKVKPGGYTKPNLQEAYLKGLEQSGAKLNKTGQIVKQSGQAYKKVGWDREAQLKAMDPMRRQRMLAIDKAHIGGSKQGPVPTTAMKPEKTGSKREIYRRRSLATDPDEFLKKIEGKGDSNPHWSLEDAPKEDIEKLFDGFR